MKTAADKPDVKQQQINLMSNMHLQPSHALTYCHRHHVHIEYSAGEHCQ
jgi:hypothetical protein